MLQGVTSGLRYPDRQTRRTPPRARDRRTATSSAEGTLSHLLCERLRQPPTVCQAPTVRARSGASWESRRCPMGSRRSSGPAPRVPPRGTGLRYRAGRAPRWSASGGRRLVIRRDPVRSDVTAADAHCGRIRCSTSSWRRRARSSASTNRTVRTELSRSAVDTTAPRATSAAVSMG